MRGSMAGSEPKTLRVVGFKHRIKEIVVLKVDLKILWLKTLDGTLLLR
jgi:hypothetical protein